MLLIGAGSHAQRLLSLLDLDGQITAFVSPEKAPWLNAPALGDRAIKRLVDDESALATDPGLFVLGIGGVSPEQLARRRALAERYEGKGWQTAALVCETANVHRRAVLQRGAHILNGAIVSPHAVICAHALINCGAVVEHHSVIGRGSHVAPGAIVLGNVVVGDDCMIGANATVIEGAKVPDGTMIKAGTVWAWRGVCESCGNVVPLRQARCQRCHPDPFIDPT